MKWLPHPMQGVEYDLSHLHDTTINFIQPAKGDAPERLYEVDIEYSMHCFTARLQPGEKVDSVLAYSDSRETRHFDTQRYELSKQLPAIVPELYRKKCFHSGKGNFFLVELVDQQGQTANYEIYFALSRVRGGNGRLKLYVQSAYVRTRGNQPRKSTIRFYVLLYNIQENRPITAPK